MYDEGPVLLSLKAVEGQNILPQLRNDLKASVASKGFRLYTFYIKKRHFLKLTLEIQRARLLSC